MLLNIQSSLVKYSENLDCILFLNFRLAHKGKYLLLNTFFVNDNKKSEPGMGG